MSFHAPLACILLALGANAQQTWYVDAVRGSDLNAGTSPGQAFATITAATAMAVSGDGIQVAAGRYAPSQGETLPISPAAGVTLTGVDPRFTIIDAEYPGSSWSGHTVSLASRTALQRFGIRAGAPGSVSWWSAAIRITETGGVSDVIVDRCIIDTCARGIRIGGPGAISVDRVTISNNLIVRSSSDAISMWGDPAGTLGTGNLISHNTILGNSAGQVMRTAIEITDNLGVDVFNNVLYGYDFCAIAAGGSSVVRTAYNNLYLHSGSFGGDYCIASNATHTIVAPDTTNDPLFVDAALGDPHLSAGSPCIDAGDPALTARLDLDGHGISGTAVDQGCDERQVEYLEANLYWWPFLELGGTTNLLALGQPGDAFAVLFSPTLNLGGPIDLGSIGTFNLDPLNLSQLFTATLSTEGEHSTALPMPASPIFAGIEMYFQSLHYDGVGFGLSPLETIQLAN